MIVTLTPNPSLDRTLQVAELRRGEVVRATSVRVDPGGKGINVALALTVTGHTARAVLPLGGSEGLQLGAAIEETGIELVPVPIAQAVRTNITLAEPDGTVTKINDPGPTLTVDEAAALTRSTVEAINGASWVAGCGSLPPGAPGSLYAELVTQAHRAGSRVAIDASGAALAAALQAGPDLIKPNVHELAELTGRRLTHIGQVIDAAHELHHRGIATVVVSLGGDGAVLVDADGAWQATTPPVTVRSTVGAGDALVAGLLAAGGTGPAALRSGVAYGTAAAQLPGTQFPTPDLLHLDAVTVTEADPDRQLTEPGGTR
jgi:1-phosphofructokinase